MLINMFRLQHWSWFEPCCLDLNCLSRCRVGDHIFTCNIGLITKRFLEASQARSALRMCTMVVKKVPNTTWLFYLSVMLLKRSSFFSIKSMTVLYRPNQVGNIPMPLALSAKRMHYDVQTHSSRFTVFCWWYNQESCTRNLHKFLVQVLVQDSWQCTCHWH